MADFRTLLRKPMDEVKAQPVLPAGTYHGRIVSYELGESSRKRTPFVRYHVALTGAGDDVDPADLEGISLTDKKLRTDFFITDDATFRLKQFLESDGSSLAGRSLGECIGDVVNGNVLVAVTQRTSSTNADQVFNTIGTITRE